MASPLNTIPLDQLISFLVQTKDQLPDDNKNPPVIMSMHGKHAPILHVCGSMTDQGIFVVLSNVALTIDETDPNDYIQVGV